jgi:hypothetical protein
MRWKKENGTTEGVLSHVSPSVPAKQTREPQKREIGRVAERGHHQKSKINVSGHHKRKLHNASVGKEATKGAIQARLWALDKANLPTADASQTNQGKV